MEALRVRYLRPVNGRQFSRRLQLCRLDLILERFAAGTHLVGVGRGTGRSRIHGAAGMMLSRFYTRPVHRPGTEAIQSHGLGHLNPAPE